jgi:hypothetical protein
MDRDLNASMNINNWSPKIMRKPKTDIVDSKVELFDGVNTNNLNRGLGNASY